MLKPSRKDILTLLLCEDDHYQLHQLVLFSLIGDLNDEKMAVINKLKHSLSDAKFPYFDMDVSDYSNKVSGILNDKVLHGVTQLIYSLF